MTLRSGIYSGTVVHQRFRPKAHRLRYGVFAMLLDLDELPELDRRFALFAHNRFAPLAFHDRDHGPATGAPLRPWAEERLREAGLTPDGGPIRLLCYPRVFGYVFNPLSVYFCYRRCGTLAAILYEVCNTFRERHTYVIPVPEDSTGRITQRCRKSLYVSPFVDMDADYLFHVRPPAGELALSIRETDAGGPLLTAVFRARHMPFTGGTLMRMLARFPLLTLKVMAAIHWEALRLWAKGLPVYPHRKAAAPVQSSTWSPGSARG